jgi:hypothetical protein
MGLTTPSMVLYSMCCLRKVREIKRATGINVPFPEDSQSIIDTITQALLLNPRSPNHHKAYRQAADCL